MANFCVFEQGNVQRSQQNNDLVSNSRDSPLLQNTIRTATASSTMATSPIHRSQSAKYCSPIPTASSAYFSGVSKIENSTIDESDGAVISASRGIGKVVEEEEEGAYAEQRSDIDMESSGEYEREEVVALFERERTGETKRTLEDVRKEVMNMVGLLKVLPPCLLYMLHWLPSSDLFVPSFEFPNLLTVSCQCTYSHIFLCSISYFLFAQKP